MPRVGYTHLQKIITTVCVLAVVLFGNVFFTTQKSSSKAEDIKAAQRKGIAFLQHIQRSDGAICDTINRLFETWETILALKAICQTDTKAAAVKKGLAFLADNENNEGLICHNQKCKEGFCVETTAVYFSLLKLTGAKEKSTSGLQKIINLQKPTGDWDIGNPDVTIQKNFPSVTAFVLGLCADEAVEPIHKKEAINWLLKQQTPQGHWGASWEYYGCPAYALWPVMKVLQFENTDETRLAKEKAVAYILAAQNTDGSWFYKNVEFVKQPSANLQTALMLAALQQAGLNNSPAVANGIKFLLNNQQKNGSWDGGFFPIPEKRYSKQEYVFATALTVDVMHHYLFNQ